MTPLNDVIGIRNVDRPVSGMGTPKANKKQPPWSSVEFQGGFLRKIPAITDFRAKALSWARRA